MIDANTIFTYIQIIYGSITLFFVAVSGILPSIYSKRSELGHPFYRLIQFDAFINIITYLNSWIVVRTDGSVFSFGMDLLVFIHTHCPSLLTHLRILAGACFLIQNFNALALTFYRWSVMNYPGAEEKWRKWWLLVPGISVVLWMLSYCYWIITGTTTATVEIRNGALFKISNPGAVLFHTQVYMGYGVITLFANIVMGIHMVYKIDNKVKKAISTQLKNEQIKIRWRLVGTLLFTSFVMMGNLFTLTFTLYIIYTGISPSLMTIRDRVLPVTSDMVSLSLPVYLRVFDTNVQNISKKKFNCLRKGKIGVSMATNSESIPESVFVVMIQNLRH